MNDEHIKQTVKEKYSQIANQTRDVNASSCCGVGSGCTTIDSVNLAEDYSNLQGYVADADLGLGCGLPTEFALIKPGDTVVDLGSGAGNDCFVARSIAGPTGKVIGVDFTEKMIEKARANAEKLRVNNVEFRYGDIEKLPLSSDIADVVVSNCVLNLVPDKQKAFTETHRVLKPGGHFSVSDVVLEGNLPANLREAAELYVGCISGAIQLNDYLRLIEDQGFINVAIQKQKTIHIPDEILLNYISAQELADYKTSDLKILSITVYGEKAPDRKTKNDDKKSPEACCEPGCC